VVPWCAYFRVGSCPSSRGHIARRVRTEPMRLATASGRRRVWLPVDSIVCFRMPNFRLSAILAARTSTPSLPVNCAGERLEGLRYERTSAALNRGGCFGRPSALPDWPGLNHVARDPRLFCCRSEGARTYGGLLFRGETAARELPPAASMIGRADGFLTSDRFRCNLTLDDLAGLDDRADLAQRADVVERVSIHHDQICHFGGFDRPHLVGDP